jgi:hypothetical protein
MCICVPEITYRRVQKLRIMCSFTNHMSCNSLAQYGVEPFLRSCQLFSYSRNSQQFMEPKGSLPCSQEPSNGSYPKPHQSNPYHPILSLKIHFNIAHPPTSRSSQWSLDFWLSHQYPICMPPPPIVLHTLPISSSLT